MTQQSEKALLLCHWILFKLFWIVSALSCRWLGLPLHNTNQCIRLQLHSARLVRRWILPRHATVLVSSYFSYCAYLECGFLARQVVCPPYYMYIRASQYKYNPTKYKAVRWPRLITLRHRQPHSTSRARRLSMYNWKRVFCNNILCAVRLPASVSQ